MILTKQNYFSKDNNYLSFSKIRDWLKGDKQFFFKKHITQEITTKITNPMIIGSAIDCRLTESKKEYEKLYLIVTKRSKKIDTPWEYQLNFSMLEQVDKMCDKIEKTDVLKDLRKNYISQEILQIPMDLGKHFKGLCGIPDWYKIIEKKDKIIIKIVDLKTIQSGNRNKYFWECIKMNYFGQQAMYQLLIEKKLNTKKKVVFESSHLVIEKDPDEIYNSFLYRLNQERIEREKENILRIIEQIKKEKDFLPPNLTWDMEEEIGCEDEL